MKNSMMKAGLWVAFLLAGMAVQAQEQQDPYAAEKAKIREIKLSGEYYYSDVSSADVEDVKAMARQLIVLSVQEREQTSKDVSKLVADSCRYILLKRMDRPRVFAYVSKEAVAVWLRGKKPEQPLPPVDTNRERASVPPMIATKDSLPATQSDMSVRSAKDTATVVTPVVRKDTTRVTVRDTVRVTIRDTNRVVVQDTTRVLIQDTTRVRVTDTVRNRFEIRTTGNDRLDRISRMKTISEVEAWFIAEKRAGRMMFGKLETAVHPENCYLLVFSREGKVVAVLDKGEKSRRNLITGKAGDRMENYPKHGVIWFTLY